MSNQETMKSLKLFFSLDKELKYINEMNKAGWKLVYIKGGCVYHFEKTEPNEYFTILHAATKEKVMEISDFAAQCGYQSVPHTMDGLGDFLYLTGKKAEVSPEFVCEAPEKTEGAKSIYHRFRTQSIIFIALSVLLILENILITGMRMTDPEAPVAFTVFSVLFMLFTAVYLAMGVYVLVLTAKARRNYKQLQKESEIYE